MREAEYGTGKVEGMKPPLKVGIKLRHSDRIVFYADKVELLNVGSGVLSMICGSVNTCYPLDLIEFYWIDDVREEA